MHFSETEFKGVYVAEPDVYIDARGYFMESFRLDIWEQVIGPLQFIQENESFSVQGVLRGLHFQLPPYGQSKLVRTVWGVVRDVVVDMRPDSATFGRFHIEILDNHSKKQLYVPSGFAHGFLVLSPEAVVQYKVDVPYYPEFERTLRFDDPFLQIDWGVPTYSCQLSEKDRQALSWQEVKNSYHT